MNRITLSTLAIFAAAFLSIGAGRKRGGAPAGGGGHTIYHQSRVSVPRAAMPQHSVQGQGRPSYPRNDGAGARISQHAASTPPAHHSAVMGNAGFASSRAGLERTETTPVQLSLVPNQNMRGKGYYH